MQKVKKACRHVSQSVRGRWMYFPRASVTSPPAVQLSLQPLNGLLHWPVLLLFLLVLLLPLLCRELQVHGHSVSDGLGSKSWGENTEAGERSGRGGRKTVCGEKIQKGWKDRKCEQTPENRTVNRRISALAAQWKRACISLICMQIGFLPTVFGGACGDRNFRLRKNAEMLKMLETPPKHIHTKIRQSHSSREDKVLHASINYCSIMTQVRGVTELKHSWCYSRST